MVTRGRVRGVPRSSCRKWRGSSWSRSPLWHSKFTPSVGAVPLPARHPPSMGASYHSGLTSMMQRGLSYPARIVEELGITRKCTNLLNRTYVWVSCPCLYTAQCRTIHHGHFSFLNAARSVPVQLTSQPHHTLQLICLTLMTWQVPVLLAAHQLPLSPCAPPRA